jgi:hypothetical protein
MARRKAKRRRSRAAPSVINSILAYGQLSILTEGIMGAGPIGVLMDTDEIKSYGPNARGFLRKGRPGATDQIEVGARVIGLNDLLTKPEDSLAVMQGNLRNNAMNMFISSLGLQFGGKMFKSLFRSNINATNRMLKPIFGKAVKL